MTDPPLDADPTKSEFSLHSERLPHLYLVQVARAYRALRRYRDAICANTDAEDYYEQLDDSYHIFFQTSWHVKDWLFNDETVSHPTRTAATVAAEKERPLRIASDIANSAKHLVRQGDRTGADNNTIALIDCGSQVQGLMFVVELRDGTTLTALDLMNQVMESWRKVFLAHGLPTIRVGSA